MKTLPINLPYKAMKYVIPDEDGFTGTSDAQIRDDAPQWAKDEYEQWKKQRNETLKENMKL